MNVAFLFDAYYPAHEPNYYFAERTLLFENGLIRASDRHMKMSRGDVLIPNGTRTERDQYNDAIYFPHGLWRAVHETKLRDAYRRAVVSAMMFENMPRDLANRLHGALSSDGSYLGAIEVNFSYGPHLALLRNSIILSHRVKGDMARVFYSMGSKDGCDPQELEAMKEFGYTDVDWEDKGARKTIFDEFDTIEHFKQVVGFCQTVTPLLDGGEDAACELAMVLEDLNPLLFNALGAASAALNVAAHEEHVAQASISGRRYLERLADALFPARAALHNGHKVDASHYQNRLWAFLADNLDSNEPKFAEIGNEIERLVEEWNGGVHGDRTKDRMLQALADTGQLSAALLALNPATTHEPYAPFLPAIDRFHAHLRPGPEDEDDGVVN